jgi:hypothetical protein
MQIMDSNDRENSNLIAFHYLMLSNFVIFVFNLGRINILIKYPIFSIKKLVQIDGKD